MVQYGYTCTVHCTGTMVQYGYTCTVHCTGTMVQYGIVYIDIHVLYIALVRWYNMV